MPGAECSWQHDLTAAAKLQQPLSQAVLERRASVVIVACGDSLACSTLGWPKAALRSRFFCSPSLAAENGYGSPQDHAGARQAVTAYLGGNPGSAGGVGPTFDVWVNRQVMIALTTMMWMAEVLGYDTAPMEGFDENAVRDLLHIPAHARVVALLAVGRRRGDDKSYGGRFDPSHTVFAEEWGRKIEF